MTAVLVVMLLMGGCASTTPRVPVPDEALGSVAIPGIPNARFWGDQVSPFLEQEMNTLDREQIRASFPALTGTSHSYLAISGGGSSGAYGAGLLVGWSKRGSRPQFQMVTGVSTGALIAPFAFLGVDYDHVLREVYTTTTTEDILSPRSFWSMMGADAAADSSPLGQMLERHVDDDVVSAIAAEHRRGRALYIGTTDLDYMRPMIWDIGAIAASGEPGAGELIRKVLLASASIPVAFPPVVIDVTAGGRVYEELHVDGGAANQVFVYPPSTDWSRMLKLLEVQGRPTAYIIRNAQLSPTRNVVEPKLSSIAAQSISALIRTQGIGDLYQIYALSQRDGIDFMLNYIPDSFAEPSREPFDTSFMQALFKLGYEAGLSGDGWVNTPPGWQGAASASGSGR